MSTTKKGAAKKHRPGLKAGGRKRSLEETAVTAAKKKMPTVDHEALRKPVEEAKAALDAAEAEAKEITEKARGMVAAAKATYLTALEPYREGCRKAGKVYEYEGSRRAIVSPKIHFLVEKAANGIRVTVKGQPGTAQVIPLSELKESVNKAAYSYVEKHLGPREKVGNKGGSLANRLRAVLR